MRQLSERWISVRQFTIRRGHCLLAAAPMRCSSRFEEFPARPRWAAILSGRLRRRLLMQRQGELKRRARPVIVGNRYPSPMRLDNRTTDRKSHSHAAGFGGEEGTEQAFRVLGGNPDTTVFHCHQNLACFVLL